MCEVEVKSLDSRLSNTDSVLYDRCHYYFEYNTLFKFVFLHRIRNSTLVNKELDKESNEFSMQNSKLEQIVFLFELVSFSIKIVTR